MAKSSILNFHFNIENVRFLRQTHASDTNFPEYLLPYELLKMIMKRKDINA